MSHMTADLEYFKCDMCGVYMHRDIFCDHRRDCHGRDSVVLKRGECARLSDALGRETRELLLAKEERAGSSNNFHLETLLTPPNKCSNSLKCATTGTRARSAEGGDVGEASDGESRGAAKAKEPTSVGEPSAAAAAVALSCSSSRTDGPVRMSAAVSAAELERRQEARTRRAVSDRYQASLDAKISAIITEDKRKALMNFLYS